MNCTSAIYESVYPEAIPAGTSVPAWAYIDVSVSDNFNATAAQLNQQQGHPESTAGGPTPTGPGSQPSQTAPVSGSKKSSNTGAIVGGVVGGLGGAAILAAAAFFFWRRYQRGKYVPKSTTGIAPAIDESTFAPGVVPSDEKHASYQPGYAPVPASSPSPAPGFNGAGIGAGFSPGKVYVSPSILPAVHRLSKLSNGCCCRTPTTRVHSQLPLLSRPYRLRKPPQRITRHHRYFTHPIPSLTSSSMARLLQSFLRLDSIAALLKCNGQVTLDR